MKWLRYVLPMLAALPLTAASQTSEVDGLTASPGNFKLLLENEHVRVLEYTLKPGERDQTHTHPPKVSYVVTGGALRVTTEDGKSFLADETAGTAEWSGALGKHFVENVGSTPVRIVLVEVKDARSEN
jgi:quercetin dioxygenase-like cupin family protein